MEITKRPGPIKVFLVCTGVGVMNRGIETFARGCFDGLHRAHPDLDIRLYKGRGPMMPERDEARLWCLPRDGALTAVVGKVVRRPTYAVEQVSSLIPLLRQIKKHKPDIVFTSEMNLLMRLYKIRNRFKMPFKIIFSNGAPTRPPSGFCDHVHQVTPAYMQLFLDHGEPESKHTLAPYGLTVPDGPPPRHGATRVDARSALGLPADRPTVLSVGWITNRQKRMDYLVREMAAIPEAERPYLVMLGMMDENSKIITDLADEMLGAENYRAVSVPPEQVDTYYAAADLFALASIQEGFGRVFLEALSHGLPCVVHDHAVMRYVLDDQGIYVDMAEPGAMRDAIIEAMPEAVAEATASADAVSAAAIARRQSVRRRFAWENLVDAYMDVFRRCLDA